MSQFQEHHNTDGISSGKDENENISILELLSKYQSIYSHWSSSGFQECNSTNDISSGDISSNDMISDEYIHSGKMYNNESNLSKKMWPSKFQEHHIVDNSSRNEISSNESNPNGKMCLS